MLYKYHVNKLLILKIHFDPHFLELFFTKRGIKCYQKNHLAQNTVCLKQQIYASKENFTRPLIVMVETFRSFVAE